MQFIFDEIRQEWREWMLMEKMQENEFEQLAPQCNASECDHSEIVKLYYLSTHSDYGCKKCKMQSLNLDDFRKNCKRYTKVTEEIGRLNSRFDTNYLGRFGVDIEPLVKWLASVPPRSET